MIVVRQSQAQSRIRVARELFVLVTALRMAVQVAVDVSRGPLDPSSSHTAELQQSLDQAEAYAFGR